MCYSHYHLNLPKPIRSWFPGRLVPPFVVTAGRTERVCREGWGTVCVGPWEAVVHGQALESDEAPYDSPRACCGLQVVKPPFQPQGHLVPAQH